MKKKIIIIIAVFLSIGLLWIIISIKEEIAYRSYWTLLSSTAKALSSDKQKPSSFEIVKNEWFFSRPGVNGTDENGLILLSSGEKVYFSFKSHHTMNGRDSIAVFLTDKYEIRTVGNFCCEVQFGENMAQSKDTKDFIQVLNSLCDKVNVVERTNKKD